MKNIVLLLFVFNLQIYAEVTSQNKVTMHLEDASLLECIKEIERQTDLGTFYNYREVRKVKGLNVKFDNETIENALSKIFKGTKFTYSIRNNVILVSRAPEKIERVFEKEEKFQQAIKITGQIVDEEGTPIPGASVVVKSIPTIGVISDVDGNYSIDVPPSAEVLVYSFVGMITQEITIAGQSVINITLEQDILGLEEVVVVGYGIQNKERIGSSISEIKSEEIETKSIGITNVENMLGGNIKGLQISQGSGAPGAASIIRVRGITSPFSGGNNQPLYVIDGVAFNTDEQLDGVLFSAGQNPLETISPSEIESISVLKDAGATAIYGSRGANGVIIITTKRGTRNEKMNVSFDASMSVSNPIKKWDLLDAIGYQALHEMVAQNTIDKFAETNPRARGLGTAYTIIDQATGQFNDTYFDAVLRQDVPMWGNANTDWQDEVYRNNAITQKYILSFSGGNSLTNYTVSLYHNDQDAMMINEYQKRYGGRLSLDTDVNKWLRIGSSLNVSGGKNFIGRNTSSGFGPATEVLESRPDWPIYDDLDKFLRQVDPLRINANNGIVSYSSLRANPVAASENRNITKSLAIFGNTYLQIEPLKDLKLRTELNVSNFTSKGNRFTPVVALPYYSVYDASQNVNNRTNSYSNALSTTLNFQANYMKVFENHVIDLMAGASSYKPRSESERSYFRDMADDEIMTNSQTGEHVTSSMGRGEAIMNSLYSRLQYSYKGKYTLTFNMRSDKSSKFGPGNKRGNFPSLAVNWNMTEEGFMKSIDFLDRLKLRASYGKTGLANIGDFRYLRFWSTPYRPSTYEDGIIMVPETVYPNENIKWETTKEFNAGVDFALFTNRLYGSVDYYNKYTNGAIMPTPIFAESGASEIYDNRAEISNKGMEFELGGDILRTKDFRWSASVNIAYNRNILESIEGNAISQWVVRNYVEGEPIGIISGLKVEKIIQTQEEINELNARSPTGLYMDASTGVGDYLYVDENKDGLIDAEDKTIIGTQEPDFFGGFSTSMHYKNFSLTAGFQYSVGNEKRWNNASNMYLNARSFANMGEDALYNTWTEERTDAEYPRLAYGHSNNSYFKGLTNDRAMQDASYLRLKVLNLSYSIPKSITDKLQIAGASIYIGGTNLLTFTNFKGLDPESVSGSYSKPGETGSITSEVSSSDAYPMAKTYTMGLKVRF